LFSSSSTILRGNNIDQAIFDQPFNEFVKLSVQSAGRDLVVVSESLTDLRYSNGELELIPNNGPDFVKRKIGAGARAENDQSAANCRFLRGRIALQKKTVIDVQLLPSTGRLAPMIKNPANGATSRQGLIRRTGDKVRGALSLKERS
jgi:hypothetical protein